MKSKHFLIPVITVFIVLLADQILKFWIKLHLYPGQQIEVIPNFFYLHFTENEGMAFGLKWGGSIGKLILSIFRIFAIGAIVWLIREAVVRKYHIGLVFSMSLILAGAVGNMIDSAFYGLIFDQNPLRVAQLFPKQGGYAPFLYGEVVDMLYFPIFSGRYPDGLPIIGGRHFVFFGAIFNIADSAITVGVAIIFLFQKRFFKIPEKTEKTSAITNHQDSNN